MNNKQSVKKRHAARKCREREDKDQMARRQRQAVERGEIQISDGLHMVQFSLVEHDTGFPLQPFDGEVVVEPISDIVMDEKD